MEQNNYQGVLQHPLLSGFDASSTAQDVIQGVNLTGKYAIITGASTGIGLETAKVLAKAGANVIVAVRDLEKAKRNFANFSNIEILPLDLMDPHSITSFAERYLSYGNPLHLLINNAGIMWVPLRRDSRGLESQFATNYLAQFHLTALLWPALRKTKQARVINLSSEGHQFGKPDFSDLQFKERSYDTLAAYGQSKSASNLFSVELNERAKKFGIQAYAVHPGAIGGTELAREAPLDLFIRMGFVDEKGNLLPEVEASLKTVEQGAATTVWTATSPLLNGVGGVYCLDCDIASKDKVATYSLDTDSAKRLWAVSEDLIGAAFVTE